MMMHMKERLRSNLHSIQPPNHSEAKLPTSGSFSRTELQLPVHDMLFASSGTVGVVDLGASQTVIGSKQVTELLQGLPDHIRSQVRRMPCQLVFRFGNQQTLSSQHALMLPLNSVWFRIAVVPGHTPFLLSSTFLKQIKAVIDTDEGTMWSKTLKQNIVLERSPKNLFLMDINQLWMPVEGAHMTECQTSDDSTLPENSQQPEPNTIAQGNGIPSAQSSEDQHVQDITINQVANHTEKFQTQTLLAQSPLIPTDTQHHAVINACGTISGSQEAAASSVEPDVSRGSGSHDLGRARDREDCVRGVQEGPDISSGIRRCQLDGVHPEEIREQREAGTHAVHPVCQASTADHAQDLLQHSACGKAEQSQAIPDPRGPMGCPLRLRSCDWSREQCHSGRDERSAQIQSDSAQSHRQRGDGHSRDADAPSWPEGEGGAMRHLSPEQAQQLQAKMFAEQVLFQDHDLSYDFHVDQECQSFHKLGIRHVQQFQKELQDVIQNQKQHRFRKPRLDFLEVMCSDDSAMVKQVISQGGRAKRFGLAEGDLSAKTGRRALFEILVTEQPHDLWYSPECGPWSKWSNLNMHKSMSGYENIFHKRQASIWQISLGIVLYRFQKQQTKQFHMEQPDGSLMIKSPLLSEIRNETQTCKFDLCKLGDLRDPVNSLPIRKRLQVLTTSRSLHRAIHGKLCNGEHAHQPIAGSTRVDDQNIARSKFTEIYPQKFAKQVVKVLLLDHHEKPIYAADTNPVPLKRRRLSNKMSPEEIARRDRIVDWQTVMSMANQLAPRVGNHIVDQGEIIDCIHQLCPDHQVHHIVLCRGTDRYAGPQMAMPKGTAPLRRRICIQRHHEVVDVDQEWEPWERLTLKALKRKGTPARVGLTIFASVKINPSPDAPVVPTESSSRSDRTASADDHSSHRDQPSFEIPEAKRACISRDHDTKSSETTPDLMHRQVIDLASQKHGPKFLELTNEQQSWLLKLHRNLGHPGTQKLAEFCRQVGCPDNMIHAVGDLKCSTCAEHKAPHLARPSAIHEPGEFGDVLSMDGIVWTNKQGQKYHIYHFIDQSTLFHTAMVTPAHSAEAAIEALHKCWLLWAGAPGLLCIDAATELNSEEFLQFLQRYGIQHRTIATDAHWQNSRSERHNAILQNILDRMDTEESLNTYEKVQLAVSQATHTKNQWSRRRGYPPEMLVFGKSTKVPGSNVSDTGTA